ncbi:FAD-dependent oxidoreductase [Sulfitobacter sp. HNIBRBA3233]|uniref:NAD(P)/FAD-dependent oxidoreductase n=1 Tax=Sulfitobacter marinivivus TaxID=3158558 RepID=UPI0032DF9C40
MVETAPRIAVVGAGMAGLTCARDLARRGARVVVFDKGRGLGGRMATRRAEGGFQFDHGAQYLTARGDGFASLLARAETDGALARWPKDVDKPAYVGVPGMTGFAKYLSTGIDIHRATRIESIRRSDGRWLLEREGESDSFDRVVLALPAPQITEMLPDLTELHAPLAAVGMAPCLTLMVGLDGAVGMPFGHRRAPDAAISWIACDSDKPARPDATCIVAQASADWSVRHLELEKDAFAQKMLPMLADAIGAEVLRDPAYVSGHRWRYAFVSGPLGQPFVTDRSGTLFAGGDWCLGAKAEHAWESGKAMAEAVYAGL